MGLGIEPELTAKVFKTGLQGIRGADQLRTAAAKKKGKKITWRTGWFALWVTMKVPASRSESGVNRDSPIVVRKRRSRGSASATVRRSSSSWFRVARRSLCADAFPASSARTKVITTAQIEVATGRFPHIRSPKNPVVVE